MNDELKSRSQMKRAEVMSPGTLIAEIERLRAENEGLRQALEFYADPNGPGEDSNFCLVAMDLCEVTEEGYTAPIGTTARAALEVK